MNNRRKSVNQQHHSPSWYEFQHHFHTHRIQFHRLIEDPIQQRNRINRYPSFPCCAINNTFRAGNVCDYYQCIDSKEDDDDSDSSESNNSSNNNEDSMGDMNMTLMKLRFDNDFEHLVNYFTPTQIMVIIDNWPKPKTICFEQWLAEYIQNSENDDKNNSNNNSIDFGFENALPTLRITFDDYTLQFGYEMEKLANKIIENTIWFDGEFVGLMSDWQ